ncbi:MAG: chromate transporter [Candidatus Pristimantibacillus sp.]
MLWDLFITFLRIGSISFGGGYAVIPMIQYEAAEQNWLPADQLPEIVSLAGMAPGPIATNTATLIGYHSAGIAGAIISTIGIILPSLLIVIILASVLYRFNDNKWVRATFYGLRPIIAGLIVYAAIHFGMSGMDSELLEWTTLATLLICAGTVYGILKHKLHPLLVIALSAVVGIIVF